MQTFKDLKALEKRLMKCNGLLSMEGCKDFVEDKFVLNGQTYKLLMFGTATGNTDAKQYSYVRFEGEKKGLITIFYLMPVDNGIMWEKRPFLFVKIDVDNI